MYDLNELIKHLETKKSILQEIYIITSNVKLSGSIDEVDAFHESIEKREKLLNEVKAIDNTLLEKEFTKSKEVLKDKTVINLETSIKEITSKIVNLMEAHSQISPIILEKIKAELRNVNKSRNINSAYQLISEYDLIKKFDISQ